MTATVLAAAFTCSFLVAEASPWVLSPSPFSPGYTVAGFLRMPHYELEEPFVAHYDRNAGKSRVDYHDGRTKTFQIGSELHKVIWTPNVETHLPEEKCFKMSIGGNDGNVRGIIPDLTDFKFVRSEPCDTDLKFSSSGFSFHGSECSRFEKTTNHRDHVSKAVFWVTRDTEEKLIPVRYLVLGHDNLLKSPFDEYEVVYNGYSPRPPRPDVFLVRSVTDKPCVGFPSQPELSVSHLFDPMKEFVHHDDSHVDEHFSKFKKQHEKAYESEAAERQRRHNFLHNMRFVNSQNRRNLSYALKLTHLSDLSRSELSSFSACASRSTATLSTKSDDIGDVTIPDSIDWRLEGAVTPVKNQGGCGSCWSFAAVALLESQFFLKHKTLLRFSEQELVDCAWRPGVAGCMGGEPFLALQYVKEYGLSSETQYGPYLESNGKCRDFEIKNKTIATLKDVRQLSERDDLRKYIALRGPVLISMEVKGSFGLYSHGVYEESDCGSDLNHALLAVGYGTLHGKPYWLIKNSWGADWGSEGYFLISRENNTCGVRSMPVIAEL